MPSQYDNTYHYLYSKPTYDTEQDQVRQQRIREADYVLEPRVPRLPTREEELEYMQWLQEDIKKDPWFTTRFRKYMANPKRVPFKNMVKIRDDYRKHFYFNMAVGCLLFWPVAALVGRRAQTYAGGVAVVPYQKFVPSFPNVNPNRTTNKFFRRYSICTSLFCGFFFAKYMTDDSGLKNNWYTRPDLKPKAAMVHENFTYDETALKQLMAQNYGQGEERKSFFKRFFNPRTANFETKVDLYGGRDYSQNFYAKDGGKFPTLTHDYQDHIN